MGQLKIWNFALLITIGSGLYAVFAKQSISEDICTSKEAVRWKSGSKRAYRQCLVLKRSCEDASIRQRDSYESEMRTKPVLSYVKIL